MKHGIYYVKKYIGYGTAIFHQHQRSFSVQFTTQIGWKSSMQKVIYLILIQFNKECISLLSQVPFLFCFKVIFPGTKSALLISLFLFSCLLIKPQIFAFHNLPLSTPKLLLNDTGQSYMSQPPEGLHAGLLTAYSSIQIFTVFKGKPKSRLSLCHQVQTCLKIISK